MVRNAVLAWVGALSLSLAACGGDDGGTNPPIDALVFDAPVAVDAPVADAAPMGTRIVAVTATRRLLTFDALSPGAVSTLTIAGVVPNETIRGIDYRPATGQVVLFVATAGETRVYVVDPDTGIAGAVGGNVTTGFSTALGFDVNPSVDRLRVTSSEGGNIRVNPDTGALQATDTAISPSGTQIIGAAYTPAPMLGSTTLYAIDRADSTLVMLGGPNGSPSPNTGVANDVGALAITLDATRDGGFDIAPDGTAYAGLSATDQLARLYKINLLTGAASAVGMIGDGAHEIVGLTVVP